MHVCVCCGCVCCGSCYCHCYSLSNVVAICCFDDSLDSVIIVLGDGKVGGFPRVIILGGAEIERLVGFVFVRVTVLVTILVGLPMAVCFTCSFLVLKLLLYMVPNFCSCFHQKKVWERSTMSAVAHLLDILGATSQAMPSICMISFSTQRR